MLIRLNPTKQSALNIIIKIEQTIKVKKVPKTGSKSRSSISPKNTVGIIIIAAQIKNLRYLGFSAQFLANKIKLSRVVKP